VTLDVAQEWPVMTIGELLSADEGAIAIGPFGSSMKADTYTATGIPVVRGNNLTGRPGFFGEFVFVPEDLAARFPRCLVRAGDLVFPHRGAIGQVGLVIDQGYDQWMLSTSMMKLRPDPERLDSQFAFYFFRSSLGRHQLLKNASQVGTPGIGQPLSSLRACELALPPIEQQHAISGVLGALDDKIEQNRRTAQVLEQLARAIFRAWFVDFEPVKAKAEGSTAFPSMPQPVFDALPTRFVDSEIGPVPEGWEVKAATQVATVAIGKTPPRKEPHWFSLDPADVRWVSIKDMGQAGTFISDTSEYLTENAIEKCRVRRIPDKSVLFSFKLTVGRVSITDGEMTSNEAIAHFVPHNTNQIGAEYIYCYLSSFDHGQLGSTSSIATATNSKAVKALPIIAPPEPLPKAFTSLVRPHFQLLRQLGRESRKLAEMRDYLLPKLLSGGVRLPGPNKALSSAS